jgi:hypothetical protein
MKGLGLQKPSDDTEIYISFILLINFCYLKMTQCYHQLFVDDFVIYYNILGELVIVALCCTGYSSFVLY